MIIERFDEIDSTNTYLKNLKDKEEFRVAIAKKQTVGRGRRGNSWSSEVGGGYFSFLLKEEEGRHIEEYTRLPLVVGYSLMKTFEELEPSLDFKFKWTNDVYLGNKKLSGILVEKQKEYFIIGIGLNLNNEIGEEAREKGGSLKSVTNKIYDIETIILKAIEDFKINIRKYLDGEWNNILAELNSKNYLKDRELTIKLRDESEVFGIGKFIDESGEMIIDINGEEKRFSVGEIHIKKIEK